MRRTVLGALALLVLGPPLWALEPPAKEPDRPKTEAQKKYDALTQEFQKAQQAAINEYREAKTNEEREKAAGKFPRADQYAPRFLKLAEENPADPAAVDALAWVAGSAGHTPDGKKALGLLLKDHLDDPKLARVCQSLMYTQTPEADQLLRAVMDKSPSHEARGWATYVTACHLQQQGSEKAAREAEGLFEKVGKDYGDVKGYGGTLADLAKGNLFEIRHLAIGKTAPEIEGEDLDGKPLKLSDYKGKVVVLDFWGNW